MNTAADSTSRQIKKIGLAADHAGFALKSRLVEYVTNKGYESVDLVTETEELVDYPDLG